MGAFHCRDPCETDQIRLTRAHSRWVLFVCCVFLVRGGRGCVAPDTVGVFSGKREGPRRGSETTRLWPKKGIPPKNELEVPASTSILHPATNPDCSAPIQPSWSK